MTCRQASWQRVSGDHPIYSLKEKACVPLDVRFFESTNSKANEYCNDWKNEAGFSDEHVMRLFSNEAICEDEQNYFRRKRLSVIRPVVAATHWGTGYLYFVDSTTPYVDGEGKEHGRWVQRNEKWYCGLPAQNFFARYDTIAGENFLLLEGLSLAVQRYELRGTMGGKYFWANLDMHSPFAQVENTVDSADKNTFVVSDAQGNIITQVFLTFILDPLADPILTCF
ncbi:hypothetical protein D3C87_1393290 [compost metagenome]